MSLDLHDLSFSSRRTPPTFYPLANPEPVRVLTPVRVAVAPALPVVADELPPCRCRRCHRMLRAAPSIVAGIGPSCAKREGVAPTVMPLFAGLEVA